MSRLSAVTVPVTSIEPARRDAMWRVFERYYDDVDRQRFDADLEAKDDVILLLDGAELRGFSTLQVSTLQLGRRQVISVFSGDTVIDAAYHGQRALQWAFFRYIVATKLRNPHRLVVWFLISKGYKTYLLLSRNFTTWWPRRDLPTPPWAREIIDSLARERFGSAYDPETSLLRMHGEHGCLRPDVAPVEGHDDPDIGFFVRANPGHAQGDELCCIGVVDAHLMLAYPLKLLRRQLR